MQPEKTTLDDAHAGALPLGGAHALARLKAETRDVLKALEKSYKDYQELLTKCAALEASAKASTPAQRGESARARAVAPGYVLALLDAHDIKFIEKHIHHCERGGLHIAHALADAVSNYLHSHMPTLATCDIVIRAYADYNILSEEMHVNQGDLNVFAQAFSTAWPWYEFTNIGFKHYVREKVASMTSWRLNDERCKHIFLFAADATEYFNVFQKHSRAHKRLTIITDGLHHDIQALGFHSISMTAIVPDKEPPTPLPITIPKTKLPVAKGLNTNAPFYPRSGHDRYLARTPSKGHVAGPRPKSVSQPSSLVESPQSPPRMIPLNAAGHRIDPLIQPSADKERSAYKTRTRRKNLCSVFFLADACRFKEKCHFDHSPITPAQLNVLKEKMQQMPCHSKGACRNSECYRGHVCLRKGCKGKGKDSNCKYGPAQHGIDMEIATWARPANVPTLTVKEKKHPTPSSSATIPTLTVKEKKHPTPSSSATTATSTSSMDTWPMMVSNLIEI
ncbi:hypothetical protein ACEQ8H_003543 [Pleosporales sp. CAS-2024a]